MSVDENIPAGADRPDAPFNEKEPRMKECPECGGQQEKLSECCGAKIDSDVLICSDCKDHSSIYVCEECSGEGEVEMTADEIRDEIEEKKENKNSL